MTGWRLKRFDTVIARSEATKQSILSLCGIMDCFASLAMTRGVELYSRDADSQKRSPDERSDVRENGAPRWKKNPPT